MSTFIRRRHPRPAKLARGQAIIEFLVEGLVLVPLLVLTPLIGK